MEFRGLSEWGRILDLYVTNPASPKNVIKAFRDLKLTHADVLATLEAFSQVPLPKTGTPSEFSTALSKLQAEFARVKTVAESATAPDDAFLRIANDAEQALVDMSGILSRPPTSCPKDILETLKKEAHDANSRREEVTLARKYVGEASVRRNRMLDLVYVVKKNALLKAHSAATGQALNDLKSQFAGILELGDRLPEFIAWSFSCTARGYGDGEITYYLQFERGLENIAKEIAKANEARARFEAIKGIPDDLRNQALREVDVFIEDQIRVRTKYEAMGWKGFLERQRLLVAAMQKIRAKYPPACGAFLDQFEPRTRDVKDIFEYRGHEAFYKTLVNVCGAGPKGVRE